MKRTGVLLGLGLLLGAAVALWTTRTVGEQAGVAVGGDPAAPVRSASAGTRTRGGDRPPPRLVSGAVGPAMGNVQNDPRAPDYDPYVLISIGKDVADVILAEPRIATWAKPREQGIAEQLGKDLAVIVPEARLEKVECRASTCVVTAAAPDTGATETAFALSLSQLGDAVSVRRAPKGDGWDTHQVLVLFRPESRPQRAYDDWYRNLRQRRLELLRNTPSILAERKLEHVSIPEQ